MSRGRPGAAAARPGSGRPSRRCRCPPGHGTPGRARSAGRPGPLRAGGCCRPRGGSHRRRRSRWAGSGTSASRGCAVPAGTARTVACSRCPRDPAAAPLRTTSPRRRTWEAPARQRRPARALRAAADAPPAGGRAGPRRRTAGGRRRSGSPGSSPPAVAPGWRPGRASGRRGLRRTARPRPRATTSPSSRKSSPSGRACSSGKETVTSFSLRDQMRSPRSVRSTRTRMPSHFTSWVQPAPGTWSPWWRASAAHRHPSRRSPASSAPHQVFGAS